MADPGDTSRDSAAAGRGLFDFSFGAGAGAGAEAGANRSGHSFSDILNVRSATHPTWLMCTKWKNTLPLPIRAATFPRAERNPQWNNKPVCFIHSFRLLTADFILY